MRLLNSLILSLIALPALANTLKFEGQAFDPESKALLYSEQHVVERDDEGRYLSSRVSYFLPDGTPLGTKQTDFGGNPFLPSLSFEDFRTGLFTRLDAGQDAATLKRTSNGEDEIIRELELERGSLVIADAGFDRLVMANWPTLLQGEALKFEFVTLGHGRLVELQMKLVAKDKNQARFEVEAQNWFFRLLMDPIELVYDLNQRHLLEYTGVTNIPGVEDGKPAKDNLKARIVYRY